MWIYFIDDESQSSQTRTDYRPGTGSPNPLNDVPDEQDEQLPRTTSENEELSQRNESCENQEVSPNDTSSDIRELSPDNKSSEFTKTT